MLKKILILIGLLGILLPAIALAAPIISVSPNGKTVTIKITNLPLGANVSILNQTKNQTVQHTEVDSQGTIISTDTPDPPGDYVYAVTINGDTTLHPAITSDTPPVTPPPPAAHTILPIGKDPAQWDLSDIDNLIANIGNLMLSIAGGMAIIYIIIGAYHYFFAFGSEEQATTAKKTITWAIVGLVLIILSKVILTQVWTFMTDQSINFLF